MDLQTRQLWKSSQFDNLFLIFLIPRTLILLLNLYSTLNLGSMWFQHRALEQPWPLNCDLCISNPLIMCIPSSNPSLLSVCTGICCQRLPSSSWSGLRPALATPPRSSSLFSSPEKPLWRSPWQPWLLPPCLLTLFPALPNSHGK